MADELKPSRVIFTLRHDVVLLPEMSLKVATLHVVDQLAPYLKGKGLTEALKALGFK